PRRVSTLPCPARSTTPFPYTTLFRSGQYTPIIRQNLEEVGFYDQYRLVLDVYESLPITSKPNLSLDDYVVNQSLNGLFSKMADEEKSIRANPLQRGSEILGTVFGKLN